MTHSEASDNALAELPLAETLLFKIPEGTTAEDLRVAAGDAVFRGQRLIAANRHAAASVHASASGVINSIDAHYISMQPDATQSTSPTSSSVKFDSLRLAQQLNHIHSAGLVGLGGGCYPMARKLRALHACSAKLLLINAVECDASIECDRELLQSDAATVIAGTRLLQKITNAQRTVIAIKRENAAIFDTRLQRSLDSNNVELLQTESAYPVGYESYLLRLIHATPFNYPPVSAGLISFNVASCYALARLALAGEPLHSRLTTVKINNNPAVTCRIPFGTPVSHIINQLARHLPRMPETATPIRIGGAISGKNISLTNAIVDASYNSLIIDSRQSNQPPSPCIRCGYCSDICPESLAPHELYRQSCTDIGKIQLPLSRCIECGLCDQVCPSYIPLTAQFRKSKLTLARQQTEQRDALQARTRYEQREARLKAQAVLEQKQLHHKQSAIAPAVESTAAREDARKKMLVAALQRNARKKTKNQKPDHIQEKNNSARDG